MSASNTCALRASITAAKRSAALVATATATSRPAAGLIPSYTACMRCTSLTRRSNHCRDRVGS
jgi:hypothetical protein